LEFLVGTGSVVTVFSESGAKRIGDHTDLTMGGVSVATDGAQTLPDEEFTVAGKIFDGLVSSNTLNRYDVLFDAPGGRLVLQAIGRSVEWPGMTMSDPVPLRIFHAAIVSLDVELNGKTYPAMLELTAASLIVNEGVRTEASMEQGRAGTFKVGGASYANLPAQVQDHPIIQRFSPNGEGFVLVGASIAIDCAISVSYVHQELRTCIR
jgi:hypothetical protein